MMKNILFILLAICSFIKYTKAQTINISNTNIFVQRTFAGENCSLNPRSKIYVNGTYSRSAIDYNGKPQYEKTIGLGGTGLICINGGGTTTLASDKFYIRWLNNAWRLLIVTNTSPETFSYLIVALGGSGPSPNCRSSGIPIISGQDCYCQASMTLTGTAPANTPRYSQTTINSTQIVGNTTNLLYQAGNSISLNAGFRVDSGGIFETKIVSCN